MKAFLGQYAKVILIALCVTGLVVFLLSAGGGSFRSYIPEPVATAGKEDSGVLVDDIAARKAPVITVKKVKLKAGNSYNLKGASYVSAVDADGDAMTVKIEKIIQPDGSQLSVPANGIIQAKKGNYKVTYSAQETYKTVVNRSEKTATFVAD